MSMSYKDAGVDIEKGDAFVEKIKKMVKETYNASVCSGVGGFAALYDIGGGEYLAAGTDGVGTKLKLAQILNKHDTIGIDLVAMCVNDVICTGARPLFFLDYLATGKLDVEVHTEIIKGIVAGCKESNMALIGGETAEMPGMYQGEDYDLAGFCVGQVSKEKLISGNDITEGDRLIGIASSGFHSNGYSLVRKLIKEDEKKLLEDCLTPTRIYVSLVKEMKEKFNIKGLAHITGSGFLNIPRMNEKWGYHITHPPKLSDLPPFMAEVCKRSGLPDHDLFETFNMGVGLVVAIAEKDYSLYEKWLQSKQEKFFNLGVVTSKFQGLEM